MKGKIRLVLADDHSMVREGIAALLTGEADMEIVGQASDGPGALASIEKLRPDVAVLDIAMPQMTGVEVARNVRDAGLKTAVLIFSMHRESSFVRAAIAAGASGYLIKNSASTELIAAVRAAASGEMYLSPSVARLALQRDANKEGAEPQLTPRERDVLRLLADGLSSKEIASQLGIGARTVDTHRAAIMEKLNIHNIPGLVKYAINNQLSTLT